MASKMGAKVLANLYNFTDSTISALDSIGPYVYCGLESGLIHKLRVTRDEDGTITTVLMATASTGSKKHKIKRLLHSDVDPILFVLCRKRLFILSSDDFTPLREIAYDVSAFTVSTASITLSALQAQTLAANAGSGAPSSPDAMKSARGASTSNNNAPPPPTPRTLRTARSTSSRLLPNQLAPQASSVVDDAAVNESNAEAAVGRPIHRICCCLRDERRVVVFEYIWTPPSAAAPKPSISTTAAMTSPRGPGKTAATSTTAASPSTGSGAATTVLINLDAEDAQSGAVFGSARYGVLTRHAKEFLFPERISSAVEYNGVLCVGMLREYSVISLIDGDAKSLLALNGEEPGMALHDGHAYLRLNNVLFVTPVKGLPQMTKEALRMPRTILLEHRPVCFTLRHGIGLAFSKECCEVYSLYDEDVVQRLPVEDGRCVSDRTYEDMIVCASKKTIWLVVLHELRTRMLDLVRRYKLGDAADLVMRCREPSLEPELKVASAYQHLRHGAAFEAMAYFSVLIDARQLLRYIPGVRPPCAVADAARRVELLRPMQAVPGAAFSQDAFDTFLQTAHPDVVAALQPTADAAAAEVDFWLRWTAFDVHDPELTTLDAAWTSIFDQLGEAPSSPTGAGGATTRVFNGVEMNVTQFIAYAHGEVRLHLAEWLRSRLQQDAGTTAPERRAAEFALLCLLLEEGDAAGVYDLIDRGTALEVRDAAAVLVSRCQFRALALLLQRRGLNDAADTVYVQHLDIARNLTSTSTGGRDLCAQPGALGTHGEAIATHSANAARRVSGSGALSEVPFSWPLPAHLAYHGHGTTAPQKPQQHVATAAASPTSSSTPPTPPPSIAVSSPPTAMLDGGDACSSVVALDGSAQPPPLPFTHDIFLAVESGSVAHVAAVVRREGTALLSRADHAGATPLHVALATAWLGPSPVPSCSKLLAVVGYLASRGSNVNAPLAENGLRACVVPYAVPRRGSARSDALSSSEKSLLIGTLLSGAAPGFVLPP